jgi:hypothetical protein
MWVEGLEDFIILCHSCLTSPLLLQVRAICEAKDQPGCEQCMPSWKAGKTWGDCDLLAVYSGLCSSSPGAASVTGDVM